MSKNSQSAMSRIQCLLRYEWSLCDLCMCYHWWRGTCSKSTGKSLTKKRWYTAPASLLGKTTGPKCWSPNMPTQTLMENRCWYLDATVVWGLSSTQTWVLWKFTIPSLVDTDLSVNRMLATNHVFTTHFARSHWQNTTLAQWPGGVRASTRRMWYG
jgi:hypothetical protein